MGMGRRELEDASSESRVSEAGRCERRGAGGRAEGWLTTVVIVREDGETVDAGGAGVGIKQSQLADKERGQREREEGGGEKRRGKTEGV